MGEETDVEKSFCKFEVTGNGSGLCHSHLCYRFPSMVYKCHIFIKIVIVFREMYGNFHLRITIFVQSSRNSSVKHYGKTQIFYWRQK